MTTLALATYTIRSRPEYSIRDMASLFGPYWMNEFNRGKHYHARKARAKSRILKRKSKR